MAAPLHLTPFPRPHAKGSEASAPDETRADAPAPEPAHAESEESAAPHGTDESIDTLRSDARAISLRWDMCTSLTIIVAR